MAPFAVLVTCKLVYLNIKLRLLLLKISSRIKWVYSQYSNTTGKGSAIAKTVDGGKMFAVDLSGSKG